MANAIKVEALTEGIWTSRGTGDSPLTPLPKGEFKEFSVYAKILPEGNPTLRDRDLRLEVASQGGNYLHVTATDIPSNAFYPQGRIVRSEWSLDFGSNPTHASWLKLGNPVGLSVYYLGHPDRDLIAPILEQQRESYDPNAERVISPEDERDLNFIKVIAAGPVWNGMVTGMEPFGNDNSKSPFKADSMFYAELQVLPWHETKKLNLKLAIATVPETDGLWRITQMKHSLTLSEDTIDILTPPLAEAVSFFRHFGEYPEHPSEEVFPLGVVGGFQDNLGTALVRSGSQGRLTMPELIFGLNHFNWADMQQRLPEDEVRIEAQRLSHTIHQALQSQ